MRHRRPNISQDARFVGAPAPMNGMMSLHRKPMQGSEDAEALLLEDRLLEREAREKDDALRVEAEKLDVLLLEEAEETDLMDDALRLEGLLDDWTDDLLIDEALTLEAEEDDPID